VSFAFADVKEQVRQAVDIVDLVGSYVQLRRQGRNFVGLCPWHDDSRPSLNVNPDRQSFKCWVCDVGGDIFSFVMKAEGLEFREALEMLADRAGIPLRPPERSDSTSERSFDPLNDKRTLYRVLAWADHQYHQCLLAETDAEAGRAYLADRGITQESIQRFHLGFALPRWDWLLERARGTEWTPRLLERVGLLRRKELESEYYDWFRARVMFSIRDARSRPIAFGGRVLPQLATDRDAKYINSPETPLFSKSRELYGLDLARENFRDAGGAIVMEGYTDCIMAHQHGITNAVAVLGTALGERHLQVLRRYTESVTLVLDGDEAGRRRTNEILDTLLALFEKNEINLRILTLPEGIDPCDFIATQGSHAFRELVSKAADALEHKFQAVTNGLDTLTDTHRASQAAEQLLATLARIRPASGRASSRPLLREQQMVSRIAHRFHLPEEHLRNRLAGLRKEGSRRERGGQSGRTEEQESSDAAAASGQGMKPIDQALSTWDRELLELILADPSMVHRVAADIQLDDFSSELSRQIFNICRRILADTGELDFGRLMAEFDDPEIKSLLVKLCDSPAANALTDRERWWRDLLASAKRRREEREARSALAAARHDPHAAEQMLDAFFQQSRSKNLTEYERRKK
jgi:DNA primase